MKKTTVGALAVLVGGVMLYAGLRAGYALAKWVAEAYNDVWAEAEAEADAAVREHAAQRAAAMDAERREHMAAASEATASAEPTLGDADHLVGVPGA